MFETIDKSLFRARFEDYNRVGPDKNFSYRALDVLFEHLENLEDDTGEKIELDVVALCCDFAELTLSDLWADYSNLFEHLSRDDFDSDEDLNDEMLEVLGTHTQWLEVEHLNEESTYIIQTF